MKQILTLLVLSTFLIFQSLSAQDFKLLTNPIEKETAGTEPEVPGDDKPYVLNFNTYAKNLTDDSLIIEWRYLADESTSPIGWKLTGICDNDLCRVEDGVWYTLGIVQQSKKFAPNTDMLLEINVYAPTTASDGIGIYKVELFTANQKDTAVFILSKSSTGISTIPTEDNRVSIFPNPASQNLSLYIDKNLGISSLAIYNLLGQRINLQDIDKNSEITNIDIHSLNAGYYIVHLENENKQIIATRKFIVK